MGRAIGWRNRCPPEVTRWLEQVATCGLLVVQQPGPTSFVLKDPSTNRKYKVAIGEIHSCNCRGTPDEMCLHMVFVLSRVFRLPHDNPLVWQRSLLAAEVDQLIRGNINQQQLRRRGASNGGPPAGVNHADGGKPAVPRRAVQPDDVCPICCDDITEDKALVYCRFGCGNNIHATCFRQYATHNSTNPSPLLCPLCREQWGSLGDGPSHSVQCSECHGPVNGERYRCAFCNSYNLCAACFQCPIIHPQHPFDVSHGPDLAYTPATRPTASSFRAALQPPVPPPHAAALGPSDIHPMMLRELGPEDYEALLALDDDVGPTPNASNNLLTSEQAQALKRRQWSSADADMAACDTCAICLEPFRSGDEVNALPLCRHFFHVPCARRWLTECRGVCPIDNVPVPAAAFVRSAVPVRQAIGDERSAPLTDVTGTGTRGRGGGRPRKTPPTSATESDGSRRTAPRSGPTMRGGAGPANGSSSALRNPNMSLSGYCPTAGDLNLLMVGASSQRTALPQPTVSANPAVRVTAARGAASSGRRVPSVHRTAAQPPLQHTAVSGLEVTPTFTFMMPNR